MSVSAYLRKKRIKKQNINHPLHEFFLMLDEAIGVFKAKTPIQGANCGDSKITIGKTKKKGKVLFQFLDKKHRQVNFEVNVQEMHQGMMIRGQEWLRSYIEDLLEQINETMKHADRESRIIVPVGISNISKSIIVPQ